MPVPSPTKQHVRQDIWHLTSLSEPWDPITEAYAKAVGAMKARAPSDPTSWAWQSAMHGTYAKTLPKAVWNQCQHASWFFLPWHRMYVYWFEAIVRAEVVAQGGSDGWALPFWDCHKPYPDNSLPPPFRQPTMPDGTPNPLYLAPPQRSQQADAGYQLAPSTVDPTRALNHVNFTDSPAPGFGGPRSAAMQFDSAFGALELQPHNVVHGFVGGNTVQPCRQGLMNDPLCAASDPVFWVHHSNIDRLWVVWLRMGQGRVNPTAKAWLTQTFTLYDTSGHAVEMTPADVLDTVGQLGYTYQPLPAAAPVVKAATAPSSPPGGPTELIAAARNPVELTGDPVTVDVDLDPPAHQAMAAIAAARAPGHIYLSIEGLDGDENPGTVYDVMVNAPGDGQGADAHEYVVGELTFFAAKHARERVDREGPGELTHTYDITELVTRLQAQGEWDPTKVKVTLAPVGPLPPPGQTDDIPAPPHPTVRVGRISLFQD